MSVGLLSHGGPGNRCFVMLLLAFFGFNCSPETPTQEIPGLKISTLSPAVFSPESFTELNVSVDETTTSFQLLLPQLGASFVTVERLEDPDGLVLLDADVQPGLNPVESADRAAVIQVPSIPGVSVKGGTWKFFLSITEELTISPVLIERQIPVNSGRGKIQISLRDTGGFIDAYEGGALWVEGAVAIAERIFAEAGAPALEITDWRILPADEGTQGVVVNQAGGASGAEDTLFGSEPAFGKSLSVYVVQGINRAETKGEVVAWSGGSPGPAWSPSGERAGVLWAPDIEGEDQEGAGRSLAHAIGHYLGLKHTTEANGVALYEAIGAENGADDLDGTPQCPDENDLNGDLFLTWSECSDWDGNNLMFWNPVATSTELVDEQVQQMRLHPLVE